MTKIENDIKPDRPRIPFNVSIELCITLSIIGASLKLEFYRIVALGFYFCKLEFSV